MASSLAGSPERGRVPKQPAASKTCPQARRARGCDLLRLWFVVGSGTVWRQRGGHHGISPIARFQIRKRMKAPTRQAAPITP
jgi:hypothetical protein